jgi:hypothetical protein
LTGHAEHVGDLVPLQAVEAGAYDELILEPAEPWAKLDECPQRPGRGRNVRPVAHARIVGFRGSARKVAREAMSALSP